MGIYYLTLALEDLQRHFVYKEDASCKAQNINTSTDGVKYKSIVELSFEL